MTRDGPSGRSASPQLISASRRTDIPRWYGRWFAGRRREGFAEYRTAFGVPGRVSLKPQDVLGYVFWTRDARPFERQLEALRAERVPYAFQVTITPYGRDLELRRPSTEGSIASLLRIREGLPGPEAIEWRYDPIVLSDRAPVSFHADAFARLAARLKGAVRVVNVSIAEPYRKAVRRLSDPSVRWREGPTAAKTGKLTLAGEQAITLAQALARLAAEQGMELKSCCNRELLLPPSRCVGEQLFRPYGESFAARISALPSGRTRLGCRCLRSIDIGMDNTCPTGCRYCYVVSSDEAARRTFSQHDPASASLRSTSSRSRLERP